MPYCSGLLHVEFHVIPDRDSISVNAGVEASGVSPRTVLSVFASFSFIILKDNSKTTYRFCKNQGWPWAVSTDCKSWAIAPKLNLSPTSSRKYGLNWKISAIIVLYATLKMQSSIWLGRANYKLYCQRLWFVGYMGVIQSRYWVPKCKHILSLTRYRKNLIT